MNFNSFRKEITSNNASVKELRLGTFQELEVVIFTDKFEIRSRIFK